MKHLFLLLILSSSFFVKAQEMEKKRTWNVKTNVTSLIDIFSFPTVQFALGKRISEHVSVNIEAGNQFYKIPEVDTVLLVQKGYKLNADCRFYFSHLLKYKIFEKLNGSYIGIQGYYRKNQYTSSFSYHPNNDTLTVFEDRFGVKKTVWGFNCLFGYELIYQNRFICDVYLGIGFRNKKIINTDRQFTDNYVLTGTDMVPYFQYSNLSESSGQYANITFGVRIGYLF